LGARPGHLLLAWRNRATLNTEGLRNARNVADATNTEITRKTMARVSVKIGGLTADWAAACRQAVTQLNSLFHSRHINVVLETNGAANPIISVRTDPSIQGSAVHGRTTSEFNSTGGMLRAEVRLPASVKINTPSGPRSAGPGILQVIAGHEIVHALGHNEHNSQLMAQTMYKEMGDRAGQDKLRAGTLSLPPLSLSPESVATLKSIWP